MQGNRKDLEGRAVETTAGRNSGAGLSKAPAASHCRNSGGFTNPTQEKLEFLSGDLKGF